MKGIHRHLNTKKDYEYIKAHEPDKYWKPAWQRLLETKNNWFVLRKSETVYDYPEGCAREVIETDAEGNETLIIQVFREDENCKLFRLGFSVTEVEAALI